MVIETSRHDTSLHEFMNQSSRMSLARPGACPRFSALNRGVPLFGFQLVFCDPIMHTSHVLWFPKAKISRGFFADCAHNRPTRIRHDPRSILHAPSGAAVFRGDNSAVRQGILASGAVDGPAPVVDWLLIANHAWESVGTSNVRRSMSCRCSSINVTSGGMLAVKTRSYGALALPEACLEICLEAWSPCFFACGVRWVTINNDRRREVKYRHSQEVLVDIPENLVEDINIVAEHGLSSEKTQSPGGSSDTSEGSKTSGSFEDYGISDERLML
ncbi:hypothetical protein Tco_1243366 [Tanacetum coccineum]